MKMLPVSSLYDEAMDVEATESDDTARAGRGAAGAARRSRSRERPKQSWTSLWQCLVTTGNTRYGLLGADPKEKTIKAGASVR